MASLKGLVIFGFAISEKLAGIAAKKGVQVRLFEDVWRRECRGGVMLLFLLL
jgi:hypothetical protein